MQKKFLALIDQYESCFKKDNIAFNILGYVKLLFVLITGALLYFTLSKGFTWEFMLACAAAFIILIALWVYHGKIHESVNYSKGIISICRRQIDRITGDWADFEDTGAQFVDAEHPYGCDLDIVGPNSLFQYLNTTHTWHGRQAFANDLLQPAYERGELLARQEAVAELSSDIEFACNVQYHLSKIGTDSSASDLENELKDITPFMKHKALKILLAYSPVLTFIFIVGIFAFQVKSLYLTAVIIVLIQAITWVAGMPKTQRYLGAMSRLPYKLSAYSAVIDILRERDFSSEKLNQTKAKLNEAPQAIKDLSRIADKINIKHNGIIYFLANIFLLWDYECALLLEGWKEKYAHLAGRWFETLGEFESLLCLSHFANVCNNTCFPTLSEKGGVIEAVGIGHPLLPNETRVSNDFHFKSNIFIISGSNMSGKTTFLRTVGINLVLARAGGFVCAGRMTCSIFEIMTSMRINDDLNTGVSTFYAELRRIKGIIEMARRNPQMIFLIDEIFRGTNSVDRLIGAKTVISKLGALGAAGIISTHDLDLCDMAGLFGRIENHSFSEHYSNDKICFDYMMKPGKSMTTNAKYLMELVGILEK